METAMKMEKDITDITITIKKEDDITDISRTIKKEKDATDISRTIKKEKDATDISRTIKENDTTDISITIKENDTTDISITIKKENDTTDISRTIKKEKNITTTIKQEKDFIEDVWQAPLESQDDGDTSAADSWYTDEEIAFLEGFDPFEDDIFDDEAEVHSTSAPEFPSHSPLSPQLKFSCGEGPLATNIRSSSEGRSRSSTPSSQQPTSQSTPPSTMEQSRTPSPTPSLSSSSSEFSTPIASRQQKKIRRHTTLSGSANKRRRKGLFSPKAPAERGIRWHGPEKKDTVHRLPNFSPKRTPGLQHILVTDKPSPVELFKVFFDNNSVKTLCQNTNKNAAKEIAKGKKFRWEDIGPTDFYLFVGILLYMAIVKLSPITSYWRRRSIFCVPFPRTVMARERFSAIWGNLHMSDPEEDVTNDRKKDTAEYDPLHRLRPLYDNIRTNCKALWHPKQQVSIDERMVATKSKIGQRPYIKAKLTKWGIKIFVLADASNGYTTDFNIYTGKSKFASGQGLSYDVVMSLMNNNNLGSGYHLYCDSFYTSPKLFNNLYNICGVVACGAYRDKRRETPTTTMNAISKSSPRGTIRWIRKDKLVFVKWMDTREVSMCSTIHEAYSGDAMTRTIKDIDTGTWQQKRLPVPACVLAYNKFMGSVDLSHQLLQYYSVHKRTTKWYKNILYHFIDIATTNGYILHKELCQQRQEKPLTHVQFMENLAAGLCGVLPDFAGPSKELDCAPVVICPTADSSLKATLGRLRCAMCSQKTPWKCRNCDVSLCLIPGRNCYAKWHDTRSTQPSQ